MENITAVITQESAKISCNFEQVEKAIRDKLSEYEGAVFTEESKTYAKREVAGLRVEKKSLQDNMREAKKQYMAPWDEFEAQAKQLIGLYDEPINLINGQVQAFEEKRITEKKKLIFEIYNASVPDTLMKYIPLDRIYNPKWENATYKEKDIRNDISVLTLKTENDIKTIHSMDSEAAGKALNLYSGSLDLTEAVTYINDYERNKREILAREQERKRMEDEERIRREERKRLLAEQKAKEEMEAALRQADEEKAAAVEQAKAEAAQEVIDSLIPEIGDETVLYEYRLAMSADAKDKLEMYFDSVGIEWELI